MAAEPSSSPDAEISIGSVLDGRYRIDAVLGAGGMGRVYRGEHTGIGRQVAIKVLHADLNRNREAAQRFQREALASGRLDHPNIVGVSDFGVVDDGPCYLVMEALEGESLGERLTRETRLHWRDALGILRGVLLGLRHAHERGVVHRDIKPDNIFLAKKDGDAIVKILDFGIAKLYAGSPDDPASTRAGLTVGTPAYLSPEQAVGGEIKPASDLYSTTIVLFEMITGRAPFEDKDPLAMLGAHVSRTPPTIAEVAPELQVPPGLEELIQRGLIKTQAERISSAIDYLAAVDAILEGTRPSQAFLVEVGTPAGAVLGYAATATLPAAPGANATPPPGTMLLGTHTPVPGTHTPVPRAHTPVPGSHTPVPGALPSVAAATRAISLADSPPIPRNWIKVGAIVVGALAVIAIIAAIATRGDGAATKPPSKKPTPRSAPQAQGQPPVAPPAKTVPRDPPPAPPVVTPPPTTPSLPSLSSVVTEDRETRRTALIHDLEKGKTCAARKAAVVALQDLGDPAAVPALKRARYRMRGGVLGLGQSNANGCLKAAADAAIKALGGTLK